MKLCVCVYQITVISTTVAVELAGFEEILNNGNGQLVKGAFQYA